MCLEICSTCCIDEWLICCLKDVPSSRIQRQLDDQPPQRYVRVRRHSQQEGNVIVKRIEFGVESRPKHDHRPKRRYVQVRRRVEGGKVKRSIEARLVQQREQTSSTGDGRVARLPAGVTVETRRSADQFKSDAKHDSKAHQQGTDTNGKKKSERNKTTSEASGGKMKDMSTQTTDSLLDVTARSKQNGPNGKQQQKNQNSRGKTNAQANNRDADGNGDGKGKDSAQNNGQKNGKVKDQGNNKGGNKSRNEKQTDKDKQTHDPQEESSKSNERKDNGRKDKNKVGIQREEKTRSWEKDKEAKEAKERELISEWGGSFKDESSSTTNDLNQNWATLEQGWTQTATNENEAEIEAEAAPSADESNGDAKSWELGTSAQNTKGIKW